MDEKDSKKLQASYDTFREMYIKDAKILEGIEPYKTISTSSYSLRECLEEHKDKLCDMFKEKYIPQGDTVVISNKRDNVVLYEACTFLIYAHFKR